MAGNHIKKDDRGGEQINLTALIWLGQVNFGCHVIKSAKLRVEVPITIPTFYRCRKAKVSNFEVEVFGQ